MVVEDDKGNVEDSFSTPELFSFSLLFVIRQLCIGHGSCMRDSNNARGVVHTMHIICIQRWLFCSFT